jgi:methionine synthase I (cobalamin-dependent)/5,10-methylenetetrahydrofolate reductase
MSSRPDRPFAAALHDKALVADGGMGTQLYERGILYSVNYEELNLSRPEVVRKVHEDYVRAGAEVIEANTFGANAVRLARHGIEDKVREINLAAVKIARTAAGAKAYVAGAIGPTGLLFEVEDESARVKAAFRAQAEALAEAQVDLILIETMRQPQEMWLAVDAVREVVPRDIPLVAQVSIDEDLLMADGTPVLAMGEGLKARGADVIGVNCSNGPQDVFAAVEQLVKLGIPVSAMPNAGLPRRVDDRLIYVSTPEYFGVFARRMFKLGVRLVGGCCGTTPEHVRRIASAGRMAGSATSAEHDKSEPVGASISPPPVAEGVRVVPTEEKSRLAAKIARKKFVVSVEVNPPIGLVVDKAIAAAKMLIAGGVDIINIADGARAQARMSNVALAVRMQQELGIETIVHVCGRDRNLLGQVAHVMGAHALGLKNLVIITGDPPKIGDFPDATAVYDLDSIGLLKLVSGLNRGIDPGGKPLGTATAFYAATGAEPAALNFDREIDRLQQKIAAGAELIMTQPVYDPEILDRFLVRAAPFGVPVLVGLLPLASFRNAEFLHNEVPGMQIPEAVRERMRKAGSGPLARKEGVAIAREMLGAVRSKVAGAYIMPPLERYELALEVVDGFLDPR